MGRTTVNQLFRTPMRTGFLIANLILLAALAWWAFGLAGGPAGDAGPPSSSVSDRTTAAGTLVYSRKDAPDLSVVLKTTRKFASRMDSARDVTPKKWNSRVKTLSMERPAFDRNNLIVRGVVSGQGADRYAVIEYAKTGEQVLVTQGDRLQNGEVLVEIGDSHLVLEVDGQRWTTDVSLDPSRRLKVRTDRRSLVRMD